MGDSELSSARERIESVEKRLTALEEHGIDIAALRRQVAFARARLRNGGANDAQSICDEIIASAKKLTDGTESWTRADANRRVVTASYAAHTAAQANLPATAQVPSFGAGGMAPAADLSAQIQAVLSGGLLQSMLGEQLQSMEKRIEQKIADQIRQVREQFARELAQVIAARPWHADVKQVSAHASAMDGGTVELIQAQIGDLRRELSARESWYSPEDVRLLINEMGAQVKHETKPFAESAVPSEGACEVDTKSNWLTKLEETTTPKVEPNAPTQPHRETPMPARAEPMHADTTRSAQNPLPPGVLDSKKVPALAASAEHEIAHAPLPGAEPVTGSVRKDQEFVRKLILLLPEAIKNPAVQKCLLALVALESMVKPSALAELTGLRSFLRNEVKAASDRLRNELGAAVP
jgi:hypothetical protein